MSLSYDRLISDVMAGHHWMRLRVWYAALETRMGRLRLVGRQVRRPGRVVRGVGGVRRVVRVQVQRRRGLLGRLGSRLMVRMPIVRQRGGSV